ncbi:MAG: pyridoxal-phosphate dependent enzyme [Proteobacteria bacterium]|nr:pyridoxal-phosphate dependent enzyme [Pseudomonadota bacterium]
MACPITFDDVRAARDRIAPHLTATPLRGYPALDAELGHGIRVLVKHENHLPTNAFKARNAMSVIAGLPADQRRRGVIAATRGNHGAGLAWAGAQLGVPVTICVPHGNNVEKNAAIRGFGAELVEDGVDYDACVAISARIGEERGLVTAHSTNNAHVIAGAATLSLELFEQAAAFGGVDALVIAVGGGSQAVGAIVAARALAPHVPVCRGERRCDRRRDPPARAHDPQPRRGGRRRRPRRAGQPARAPGGQDGRCRAVRLQHRRGDAAPRDGLRLGNQGA